MLVFRSTYNSLSGKYRDLQIKWNLLIDIINERGGQDFLRGAPVKAEQFSKKEIKQLVVLCHPDKHGGIVVANDLTTKLLKMRAK